MKDAVTDDDKQRVRSEIEAQKLEDAAIVGSRSHRSEIG